MLGRVGAEFQPPDRRRLDHAGRVGFGDRHGGDAQFQSAPVGTVKGIRVILAAAGAVGGVIDIDLAKAGIVAARHRVGRRRQCRLGRVAIGTRGCVLAQQVGQARQAGQIAGDHIGRARALAVFRQQLQHHFAGAGGIARRLEQPGRLVKQRRRVQVQPGAHLPGVKRQVGQQRRCLGHAAQPDQQIGLQAVEVEHHARVRHGPRGLARQLRIDLNQRGGGIGFGQVGQRDKSGILLRPSGQRKRGNGQGKDAGNHRFQHDPRAPPDGRPGYASQSYPIQTPCKHHQNLFSPRFPVHHDVIEQAIC